MGYKMRGGKRQKPRAARGCVGPMVFKVQLPLFTLDPRCLALCYAEGGKFQRLIDTETIPEFALKAIAKGTAGAKAYFECVLDYDKDQLIFLKVAKDQNPGW